MDAPSESPRRRCYRCMRPEAMCLCAHVQQVATRTPLVILQHPRERDHPFGTARLARLALPNSRLCTAYGGFDGDLLCEVEVPEGAAVLFPHPAASDLAAMAPAARPKALVVLDGTWAHARRLYRHNPWLQRLPHVRLQPAAPSNYRIRKEPQADFVSTIEAIVQALQLLEPDNGELPRLLVAFDHMVDAQIAHLDRAVRHGRHKRPRQRPSRRLSAVLDDEDLVVVYAEASLPGGDAAAPRALVQWAAARARTGEVLDLCLRPDGPWPAARHLEHMQLAARDLADGVDVATARAAFAAFAGAAAIGAWSQTTLQWGAEVLPLGRPSTVLKGEYCNLRGRRASYLESVLQREGLEPVALPCRGRARQRLGNAVAAARLLLAERARLRASVAGV
ncbi:MAG: tRNA-uridine aminocarboxypropyltransferase [Planctomycetota bacterium]